MNLRDSGIPNDKICIANRDDSYAEDAKAKGFTVEHNFEKAASLADGQSVSPYRSYFRRLMLSYSSVVHPHPGSGATQIVQ